MARYLKLRGRKWWFQISVPNDFRAKYAKATIQENLHTSDRALAERKALQRAAFWHREFDIDRKLQERRDPHAVYQETSRQIEWIKRTYADPRERGEQIDLLWDGWLAPELRRLGYFDAGEIKEGEVDPEVEAAIAAIRNARSNRSEPPPEYQTSFSEIAERYLEDRQRHEAEALKAQTVAQMEAVYRLFNDHIGGKALATVDRKVATAFIDKVKRLSSNWGRLPRAKERSLDELLAISAKRGGTKLAGRTVYRFVSALSQVWEWARLRGELKGDNPFKGLAGKVKPAKGANAPWTDDAIRSYFDQIPDSSTKGRPDPLYWLPRIALLSGMRLNEICSLERRDVKSAEGVTYFDIPEGKTDSSARVVPVHHQLCSFLEIAPNKGFLFPDLKPGGPEDKRSWNISKTLGRRFRKIVGGSTFHAFRKNAAQTFEREHVPETEAAQILGHKKEGMTYGVYSPHGLRIDQKRDLIELLNIPSETGDLPSHSE